jgi:DNA mismatch endonuclease, patch repair protein
MTSSWKEAVPPDSAWRCNRDGRPVIRSLEQDEAAGGRPARTVLLADGRTARASVFLRLYRRTRRIRAYLRWSDRGSTKERYIGEVDHDDRTLNLRAAWTMARGLIDSTGRAEIQQREGTALQSWASSPATRAVMRANRGRDTKPEMLLRSRLHAKGLRYRVSYRPIAGLRRTADVAFPGVRVAVFVDGCFWHGCPLHHRPSFKNSDFWRMKIEGNRTRDAETDALLAQAGWRVIRVWEHDDPDVAAHQVEAAVRPARTG